MNCGIILISFYGEKNGGYHITPIDECPDKLNDSKFKSKALKIDCKASTKYKIGDKWNNHEWYETYKKGRISNAHNFDCYLETINGEENYYVISVFN